MLEDLVFHVQGELVLLCSDFDGKARPAPDKLEVFGSHLGVEVGEDLPEPIPVPIDILPPLRLPIFLWFLSAIFVELVLGYFLEVVHLVSRTSGDSFNHLVKGQVRDRVKLILQNSLHAKLNRPDLLGELLEVVLNPGLNIRFGEFFGIILYQFVLLEVINAQLLPNDELPERPIQVEAERLHGKEAIGEDRADHLEVVFVALVAVFVENLRVDPQGRLSEHGYLLMVKLVEDVREDLSVGTACISHITF